MVEKRFKIIKLAKGNPTTKNDKRYKIRRLTSGNVTGEAYGITIPATIALRYQNVPMQVYESGAGIILDMRRRAQQ